MGCGRCEDRAAPTQYSGQCKTQAEWQAKLQAEAAVQDPSERQQQEERDKAIAVAQATANEAAHESSRAAKQAWAEQEALLVDKRAREITAGIAQERAEAEQTARRNRKPAGQAISGGGQATATARGDA